MPINIKVGRVDGGSDEQLSACKNVEQTFLEQTREWGSKYNGRKMKMHDQFMEMNEFLEFPDWIRYPTILKTNPYFLTDPISIFSDFFLLSRFPEFLLVALDKIFSDNVFYES